MGVTLFRVDKGEHVTSVFTVLEEETDDNGTAPDETGGPAADGNDTPIPEEGSDG
jgi:hypothetical protein